MSMVAISTSALLIPRSALKPERLGAVVVELLLDGLVDLGHRGLVAGRVQRVLADPLVPDHAVGVDQETRPPRPGGRA